ncbi:MAG: Two-component transcriptional response regulator, LuxR family [Firmicutes bacterium]|nr:Two-component transcriptional response regulator, LuxR family [Bacillota bacterium]MDI6705603.1 response regulator transcription factor [Bacillota bacterium]
MSSIRLMVVDDHPIVRQGLIKLIEMNDRFKVIAEASNGLEAIRMSSKYAPDIILMDINMPDMDGIEACREITGQNADAKVIALTVCEEIDKITEALAAGAKGYILKNTNLENLTRIIREVYEGKAYIDPSVTTGLIDQYTRFAQQLKEHNPCPLSDREVQVLKLVSKGRTNKEIAGELVISEKTVKNHVTNILSKLDANDRTEASVIAMKKGYI